MAKPASGATRQVARRQGSPRVLMVSGQGPPTADGVGDYTANLLLKLRSLRPDWTWMWMCRRLRWFYSPIAIYRGIPMLRPAHAWNDRGTEWAARTVRLLQPTILHIQDQIHSFFETDAVLRLADATRASLVVNLHEFHTERPSVRHTVELARRADVVIANDRRNAQRCQDQAGRKVDHCWWSPSNVRPPEPGWNVHTQSGVITTFGQITAIKGMSLVYDALTQLHSERTDLANQLEWRIVGPFEPNRNAHHAELSRQLVAPWVRFTGGFVDLADRRLRTLLSESRLMLLPFIDGASPRRTTLQTAWALGLPVITTPPSVDEPDIRDGENCLLVREATPAAWAAAVRQLLDSPTLEAQLRIGSRRTAERFSWDRLARQHLEVYDQLLEGCP